MRERKYRHKTRRAPNQEKALYMNGPYVLALTIAALIALVLCMNYLHKQASITTPYQPNVRIWS